MNFDHGFLVPANAKKGSLIFNIFRPFDLFLFGGGLIISFFFLAILPTSNTILLFLACLPAIICGILVLPIPNYHNTLVALISIYNYYTGRKKYIWKGWCLYEQFVNESSKK